MDIEVQRDNDGADVRRARYNSGMLDTRLLEKGRPYSDLVDSYVIFITEHDVLKRDLPIYHITRKIDETVESFGDGTHIIYVNGEHDKGSTPPRKADAGFQVSEIAGHELSAACRRCAVLQGDRRRSGENV